MTLVFWLSIGFIGAIVLFFGWALCAAAKRGDEMDDELAQFSHRTWEPLP